jgi:hypothetical protein
MNSILTEFFSNLIFDIEKYYEFELDDYSVVFLLRILNNLLFTNRYFQLDEQPLAIQYMEALQKPPVKKAIDLMNIGDLSLLFATIFQDHSTKREIIDVDYFLTLSFTAFKNITDDTLKTGILHTISVVLNEFDKIANTLNQIGNRIDLIDKKDINKMLKRYDLSMLDYYRKELSKCSIFPSEGNNITN